MIDEGHHREAMWWVSAFYGISNSAIQNDAPERERAWYQTRSDRFLADLGFWTPEDCVARVDQARVLAHRVFQAVDDIVARNPDIVD
jgi:hypothetical protein